MLHTLKSRFGYDRFRPMQEDVVKTVLAGKDALVLMQTGGGKSLCFQLPAVMLPGVTLVISPLVSLMKDQVDALRRKGIPAAYVNSTLSAKQRAEAIEQARSGVVKILYLAPERLRLPGFLDVLKSLNVSLLAIDEAHCISDWGHDFRPDYRSLSLLRRELSGVPVIALTATATPVVRKDILAQLQMKGAGVFVSSFNRPNLTYRVAPKFNSAQQLAELLKKHKEGSSIVYCFSRRNTEELAEDLVRLGFNALPYHAGLEQNIRKETQDKFISGEVPIVTATIAFGMGIDKPDVRLVAHMDLPKTVEGYYQETGRAGRDGQASECVLFFSIADRRKQEYFIGQMEDPEEQARAKEKLRRMLGYGQAKTCRRAYLLDYFGERLEECGCGGCDICVPEESSTDRQDATDVAKNIIAAVLETGERFGAVHICDVLRGSKRKKILDLGHDRLRVYGVERVTPSVVLRSYVRELQMRGFLGMSTGDYPTLYVTKKGGAALAGGESIFLSRVEAEKRPSAKKSPRMQETHLETKALLEKNYTLQEMAKARGLKEGTILQHLERLAAQGKLPDIQHLRPAEDRFRLMKHAFREADNLLLTPAYKKLGEKFSYDELRLARLFL